MIKNSKGSVFYGLHFYPGVAEYSEPNEKPYRVYLNEDTLRGMDPTFAGKPIYVEHVDQVESDLDTLRGEVDGWVMESFYNSNDGKHWVKFIVVSENGLKAIQSGMRLSNAYIPKAFKQGGLWNGVPYSKEITDGEYEHLAIVRNPRYEESVILTPDEFKKYNEEQVLELKRLSNSKGEKMKFSFFKKTKVENAFDPELQVLLPKSGKSISITKLINDAMEKDEDPVMGNKKKKNDDEESEADMNSGLADMSHKVKMKDGSYCNVAELLDKHNKMSDEMEKVKKDSAEKEMDLSTEETDVDAEGDLHNKDQMESVDEEEESKEDKDNSEEHPEDAVHDADDSDEDAKKSALKLAEHEEKEIEEAKTKNKKKNELARKRDASLKAERLRNAHLKAIENEAPVIEISADRVARGKVRYGS